MCVGGGGGTEVYTCLALQQLCVCVRACLSYMPLHPQGAWRQNTSDATLSDQLPHLTAECVELLDRMLELDMKKR